MYGPFRQSEEGPSGASGAPSGASGVPSGANGAPNGQNGALRSMVRLYSELDDHEIPCSVISQRHEDNATMWRVISYVA